jgi:ABC-type transporter Mla subunit MlaD
VQLLDRQSGSVRSLVRDSATVFDTLSSRDADVQGLVRNGESVLAATAARNRAVTDTVRALPGFVTQLRSTMRRLDTTAGLATPSLRALEPSTRYVEPALQGLRRLAPQATDLFEQFERLIPTAQRALPAASRMVRALTPFTDVLYPAAQNIVPVIDLISAYKRELVGAVANVAGATNATSADSTGKEASYLRAVIPFTEEGLTGQGQRSGNNRHNPYPAPGTWETIGREGLPASDCRNVNNPSTGQLGSGAPPCRVQEPWTFAGQKRYYPHVLAATPPARR